MIMHASTLTSMADGIAEDLDRPYRTVRISPRDDVNGDYATVQVHIEADGAYDSVSNREIKQLEEWRWNFICFKTTGEESYALFEGKPFADD